MALYRLNTPLVAFAADERRAVTIPAGSLIEKDKFVPSIDLTNVAWAGKTVTVAIQDFLEHSEPLD
jgi:hypothetical protein